MMKQKNDNSLTMGERRNPKIDCLKGIAIILVVWGHFIEHTKGGDFNYYLDPMHIFIFSFHMPLFAAISGFLAYNSLKKRTCSTYLITLIKSYLQPIVMWTCIFELFKYFVDRVLAHKEFSYTLNSLVTALLGNGFWFLWSITGCAICVMIAEKIMPKSVRWVALSLGWLLLYLFPNSERSLFLYPFYVTGYLISKYELYKRVWYKKVAIILSVLFAVLIWFYTEECYVYVTGTTPWRSELSFLTQLGIDIYRWFIGLCGIAFVCLLYDFVSKIEWLDNSLRSIQDLGKYTLEIYVTQAIAVNYVLVMAVNKNRAMGFLTAGILGNTLIYDLFTTLVLTLIFVIIDLFLIRTLKKSHYLSTFLFGR